MLKTAVATTLLEIRPSGCSQCWWFQNVRGLAQDQGPKASNVDPSTWVGMSKVWDWWDYLKGKSTKTPKVPKWKLKPPGPTKVELNSITKKYLAELYFTDADFVLIKKMDLLFDHLTMYPEAVQYAVKIGCVDKLLDIRYRAVANNVKQQACKLLSALGHADPPKSRGVRILSIDGGGMRGLSVIHMLKEIEILTQKKIIDSFDLICGVSTGAIIIGCMLPPVNMTLQQIENVYKDCSTKVFDQSTIIGTGRMLWSHGYYDTLAWENLLQSYVGDTQLIDTAKHETCPKVFAVSSISVQSRVAPFIFRNYGNPKGLAGLDYYGTYSAKIYETIRASSAAPTIFEEMRIDGIPHMDGGIVLNNPTALAIHEAKNLWPNEQISCLVSCGTGLHDPVMTMEDLRELSQQATSWKAILDKICASATDTEAVHAALNNLLVGNIYFRLNPPLSKYIVMDEVDKKNLATLIEDTKMYCRRNREMFEDLSHQLVLPRPKFQCAVDKAKLLYSLLKCKFNKEIRYK
uniref:PNPLA domain-containing protein n=1 Tax=Lygus hesperus TaxID=30085 RepID=A0A0K8SVP7_LYGHE